MSLRIWLIGFLSLVPTIMSNHAVSKVTDRARTVATSNQSSTVQSSYNIGIGFTKPVFDLKYYDKLYGEPSFYPTLVSDWIFHRSSVSLGMRYRLGYFTATGKAGKLPQVSSPAEDELEKDNGKTSLALVPIDVLFLTRLGFGARKIIVVEGWVGYQELYYQETRDTSVEGTSASSEAIQTQTTAAWNGSLVFGFGAGVNLTSLDDANLSSLRTMGLGAIYLNGFIEIVSRLGSTALLGKAGETDFGRSSLGIGVLFEGL